MIDFYDIRHDEFQTKNTSNCESQPYLIEWHICACTVEYRHVNEAGKMRKACSINVSLDFAAFDKYADSAVH